MTGINDRFLKGNLKSDLLAALLCFAAVIYYFSFQDSYHDWGDDFAQYILHAKNILSGNPYSETGYIFNPENVNIGPSTYPPVFPLLLSIAISIFGENILVFKHFLALIFGLTLFVFYKLSKENGGSVLAIWMIPILGLNPFMLSFLQEIMSDIPFLFFLISSIFLLLRLKRKDNPAPLILLGTGFVMALAAGTRIAGYVVIPALLLYLFQNKKNNLLKRSIPLITFIFGTVTLLVLFPDSGRGYPLSISVESVLNNLKDFGFAFFRYFGKGYLFSGYIISVLILFFFIKGMIHSVERKELTLIAIILAYGILILAWGAKGHGIRLLLPVIPFMLLLSFREISSISKHHNFDSRLILSLISLLVLINYYPEIKNNNHKNSGDGPYKTQASDMFRAIKQNVPANQSVSFFKPRTMAYFSQRLSMGIDLNSNENYINKLRSLNITYMVLSENDPEWFRNDKEKLLTGNTIIWQNEKYILVKID